MKSRLLSFVLSLTAALPSYDAFSQVQENPVRSTKTINLDIDRLVKYGYSGTFADTDADKKMQPIRSRQDAINFVKKVQDKEDLGNLDDLVAKIFTELMVEEKSDYTVVLFRHPMNLQKLFGPDAANLNKAKVDYKDACEKRKRAIEMLKLTEKKLEEKDASFKDANGAYVTARLSAAELREMNDLSTFRNNLLTDKGSFEATMQASRKLYKESLGEIVEEEKIESYILNKENEEWSDYLFNKKKLLLVFVGGINDLAKSTVIVNNRPASYKTDLDQLGQLASGLGVKAMDAGDENNCDISEKGLQELPVTFMLLRDSKIQPPSDLLIAFGDRKDTTKVVIHEKAKFAVKVGFSGSLVDRKNFIIENNTLTIKTDDTKKEELKSNLIALFEWIPWGRDIDRLEPVWKKDKKVGTFAGERFGVVGGVKISTDPLQTILAGGSYSFSREASLNFGIAFYATPRDVTNLPVGTEASLQFLKENADRQLTPKIFVGLSFSPGQIGKSLGILK